MSRFLLGKNLRGNQFQRSFNFGRGWLMVGGADTHDEIIRRAEIHTSQELESAIFVFVALWQSPSILFHERG